MLARRTGFETVVRVEDVQGRETARTPKGVKATSEVESSCLFRQEMASSQGRRTLFVSTYGLRVSVWSPFFHCKAGRVSTRHFHVRHAALLSFCLTVLATLGKHPNLVYARPALPVLVIDIFFIGHLALVLVVFL